MKTISIVVLSVVLAAAIVVGFMFYQRSKDAQNALQESGGRAAALISEISQLREESEALRDQVKKMVEAQDRISELEHAISQKDQAFTELSKTVHALKRELEKEREMAEKTTSHLNTRETRIRELQGQVQGLRSTIGSLEEELSRSRRELQELQDTRRHIAELKEEINAKGIIVASYEERIRRVEEHLDRKEQELKAVEAELTALREEKSLVEAKISDLKSTYKEKLYKLQAELSALREEKTLAEANLEELKSTYKLLVHNLKERIAQQEVTIDRFKQEICVTFVDRVLFEFGRAEVTPEGKEALQDVGRILKEVEDRKIRVIGHTDDRPIHPDYRYKFPSNWELSSARASAVIHYFQQEFALDPTGLEAVGRAFYDPVASNQTPQGRARNRRVEIIIAPELD